MKFLMQFICFLRGHEAQYFLKRGYRRGGEVWGVKCKRCGCELETDWRGRFW